jgi:hypothetical protein
MTTVYRGTRRPPSRSTWSRRPAAAALGLLLSLLVGCASGGSTSPVIAPRPNLKAVDYYPLDSGWKWAYDLERDGENVLATYAVVERTGDTAVVQSGEDRLTYKVGPDGIAQKDGMSGSDYVIRDPLTVGAGWAVSGGRAKIVAVDREVNIESIGHLGGCVVVEVAREEPSRIVRTTFAPDIGPVALELQVLTGQKYVTTTRAQLRAVTKPGDPNLFQ